MKKSTLNDVRRLHAGFLEEKVARESAIAETEATLAELKKQADDAAKRGDVEGFEAISEEVAKTERKIFVMKKAQAANTIVTPEAARDAWAGYIETVNKDLSSGLASYEKERRQLCRSYEKLIETQNEALKVRHELAEISGVEENLLEMNFLPNQGNPVSKGLQSVPDAVYFIAAGEWTNQLNYPDIPTIARLNQVLFFHTPVEDLKFR